MWILREPLQTERLVLRPYRADDADAVFSIRSDPTLTRYVPTKTPTREEVGPLLARRVGQVSLDEDDDVLSLAAVRREDGRLIGEMTFFLRSVAHAQGEIGYVFHHDAHGQGYATEAAAELLRLGFEDLGMHRIFAKAWAANAASAAVMRRLGLRLEAHFHELERFEDGWGDEIQYAILRREWAAMRDGTITRGTPAP